MIPGQTTITDYFEIDNISAFVDRNVEMKGSINVACGREKEATVKPLLRKLLQNAEKNNEDIQ